MLWGILNRSLLSPLRSCTVTQTRNTFILKRKHPPRLRGKSAKPKVLKRNEFIYELVEDTETVRQPDLKVILTADVDGVGRKGELVSVKPNFARRELLLPGFAVYASPENIEEWKSYLQDGRAEDSFSSPFVARTIKFLSLQVLAVVMNRKEPWTIEKWHLRVSFRKSGVIVPEHAIEMPLQPITGPDMQKEGKEFAVFVTVNGKERVPVRCRIHHWHAEPLKRLPWTEGWFYQVGEPLFPEQAELLSSMLCPQRSETN